MSEKVLILLSTYNGEKYLEEQLNTILNQTTEEISVSIIIRDDGSSDNTIKIINKYINDYDCIKLIKGKNLGPALSFRELINLADETYSFYAFADQDDIWVKGKIEAAVKKMRCGDKTIPQLWYSAALKKYANNKEEYFFCNLKRAYDFKAVIETFATTNGCSMVFNNRLLQILKEIPMGIVDMHDSWVHAMCLACGGKIYADQNIYVIYRMHASQVLGSKKKTIKNFRNVCKKNNKRSNTVRLMLKSKWIENEKRKYLVHIERYEYNWKDKLTILFSKKPKNISYKEHFKFKTQIILNRY